MDSAPPSIPDFYLPRPHGWSALEAEEFERVYTGQVAGRGAGQSLEYQLAIPKWKFLCWLVETQDVLLHGSNVDTLGTLEVRQPRDPSEFGGRQAVFAASDGLWAMFFAVLDRGVATSMMNACFSVNRNGVERYYYFFSINNDALEKGAWRSGTVYVLPRATFECELPADAAAGIREHHWASAEPVAPLASLRVEPQDFPLLDQVRGHDVGEVAARAAQDPDAFPWLDEGR